MNLSARTNRWYSSPSNRRKYPARIPWNIVCKHYLCEKIIQLVISRSDLKGKVLSGFDNLHVVRLNALRACCHQLRRSFDLIICSNSHDANHWRDTDAKMDMDWSRYTTPTNVFFSLKLLSFERQEKQRQAKRNVDTNSGSSDEVPRLDWSTRTGLRQNINFS